LKLVYTYIWGPTCLCSTNGERYYLAFLYAYSRYSWIYLIHAKSHIVFIFAMFKTFSQAQTNYKLKSIQTDNAKEF